MISILYIWTGVYYLTVFKNELFVTDQKPNITVFNHERKNPMQEAPFKIIFHRIGQRKHKKSFRREVINVVRNVRKKIVDIAHHIRRMSTTGENWT